MLRYALTIFVSAFLLFQVQPLIGRFILPWFGGGPSIWTSCMLFFQAALLGGYFYAHLLCGYLTLRSQAIVHMMVLGVSLLLLPIAPDDSWKPLSEQSPLLRIMLLLVTTVGGPYFVLASTGPLMQKWFSQTSPQRSPYRLYALSNIGSLLALLSYPFAVEPWLSLHHQVICWTALYVLFVCLAAWCAVRVWALSPQSATSTEPTSTSILKTSILKTSSEPPVKPSLVRILLWLCLAACGSAVLLATTNQLCIDVATVPFLWILPLSLYLVSFIICFDQPQWYDRRAFGLLLLVCVSLAGWALDEGVDLDLVKQVAIYSAALFACCMACHGELVRSRPHPQYLTLFYLTVSAGGVVGGLFVAIVATNFFSGYWEFPISLAACCLVTWGAMCHQGIRAARPALLFWSWFGGGLATLMILYWQLWHPYHQFLDALTEVTLCGGLGFWLLVGLVAIGLKSERSVRLGFWYAVSAMPVAWVIALGVWQAPEVLTARRCCVLAGSSLLAFTIAWGAWRAMQRLSKSRQRLLGRGLIIVYALILSWLIFKLSGVTRTQLRLLWAVGASGIVVSWLASRFSFEARPRLQRLLRSMHGSWVWLPLGAIVGVVGYNLWQVSDVESPGVVYRMRNFYGVLNVESEAAGETGESMPGKYQLTHGQIQHGFQFDDEYWKSQPTTYYGRDSGLGLAIATARHQKTSDHSLRVGVIGLGTGTIAAYGEKGDEFQFYEINPAVRDLSGRYFTYLQDTPAQTKIKIGDARIVMARELQAGQRQHFDVLAVDAFSSDAIPVHLLTAECGDLYRQHLTAHGILAIHISNRFLELDPVVRGLAKRLQWHAVRIDNDDDESVGVYSSTWVLLTPDADMARKLEASPNFDAWQPDEPVLLWTDDYSGLWRILTY